MSEPQPTTIEKIAPQEFARVYDELRRMAHAQMARERADHSLQTTALVHEAYLRLYGERPLEPANRRQFFAAAAEAMRRILIEHARARGRQKRGGGVGGGELKRISLDDVQWLTEENLDQTLMFDEAICRLEQQAPDDAQVVRLRFYAGLSVDETADVLGVSPATVDRRWRFARAWLWRQLRRADDEPPA
jgi:RNA polymerase sigma factor (TIGR02999 family)